MTKYLLIIILLFSVNSIVVGQWISISSGTKNNLTQIVFGDSATGYVIGKSNLGESIVLKTNDGGYNWFPVMIKKSQFSEMESIGFINKDTGVVIDNDTIYKTNDGGVRWEKIKMSGIIGGGGLQFHMNTNTEWFYISGQQFGHTVDGGQTWFSSSKGNSGLLPLKTTDIQFVTEHEVIGFGWYGPTVFKSTDKGLTWNILLSNPVLNQLNSGCFATPSVGFIAAKTSTSRIYKSIDSGYNWFVVDSTLSFNINCIRSVNPNVFFGVGGKGGIATSVDGGNQWTIQNSGVNQNLNKIIVLQNKVIAIGDSGTILMNTNIVASTKKEDFNSFNNVHIYPNPASTCIDLSWNADFQNTEVNIFNTVGEKVIGQYTDSSNSQIDISKLQSGLYYMRLKSGNRLYTQKFIKQ